MPDDNSSLPTSTDSNRPVLTTEEVPTTTPPTQDPIQPATSIPSTPTPPADTPSVSIPETSDVPPPPTTVETSDIPPTPTPTEGSSAPSFDLPPIVGAPPRKKFGGKKVISTILGLLLLVGGVGVGVTLVRQQQDIREKAAGCDSYDNALTCSGQCVNGKKCSWKSSTGECKKSETNCLGGTTTTTQQPTTQSTSSKTCTSTSDVCGAGGQCASTEKCVYSTSLGHPVCTVGGCGSTTTTGGGGCTAAQKAVCTNRGELCSAPSGICLPKSSSLSGCTDAQKAVCANRGELCSAPSGICLPKDSTIDGGGGGGGGGGTTSSSGTCSAILSAAKCQGGNPGDSCSGIDGTCKDTGQKDQNGKAICSCKITTSTCKEECPASDGILRNCTPPEADGTPEESICNKVGRIEACGGKSYCCPSVGGKWTTNMSACEGSGQCNNIKAYDTNFNPLTADELKTVKAGEKIRFTVKGSSTNTTGAFDKAKFKINGVDQAETVLQKPESTEFYYEYTIPEGTTSFNITAQIHHSILGWSN